jgi:hypothetical protein
MACVKELIADGELAIFEKHLASNMKAGKNGILLLQETEGAEAGSGQKLSDRRDNRRKVEAHTHCQLASTGALAMETVSGAPCHALGLGTYDACSPLVSATFVLQDSRVGGAPVPVYGHFP